MSATRHRLIALLDRYDERVTRLHLPEEGLTIVRCWLADARESAHHCDEPSVLAALKRIDDACFPRDEPGRPR